MGSLMRFSHQLFIIVFVGLVIQGFKIHVDGRHEWQRQQDLQSSRAEKTIVSSSSNSTWEISPEDLVQNIAKLRDDLGITGISSVLNEPMAEVEFRQQLQNLAGDMPAVSKLKSPVTVDNRSVEPLPTPIMELNKPSVNLSPARRWASIQRETESFGKVFEVWADDLESSNNHRLADRYRQLAKGIDELLRGEPPQ